MVIVAREKEREKKRDLRKIVNERDALIFIILFGTLFTFLLARFLHLTFRTSYVNLLTLLIPSHIRKTT